MKARFRTVVAVAVALYLALAGALFAAMMAVAAIDVISRRQG